MIKRNYSIYMLIGGIAIFLLGCDKEEPMSIIEKTPPLEIKIPFHVEKGDHITYIINVKEEFDQFSPQSKRTARVNSMINERSSYTILKEPKNTKATLQLEVFEVNDNGIVLKGQFSHIIRTIYFQYGNFVVDTNEATPIGETYGIPLAVHKGSVTDKINKLNQNLIKQTFYIELDKEGGFRQLKDYPTISMLVPQQQKLKGKAYEEAEQANKSLLWFYNEHEIKDLFILLFPKRPSTAIVVSDKLTSLTNLSIENFNPDFTVVQINKEQGTLIYKTALSNRLDEDTSTSFSYQGILGIWSIKGNMSLNKEFKKNITNKIVMQINLNRNITIELDNVQDKINTKHDEIPQNTN